MILLTRKRKRWHGVMHPHQQDNIQGIRASEVAHPLPVVPIFGLKTYICPACGLWFALTAEAPGGSHLHYVCPACGCPTMDEGCFFPLALIAGWESSPLLIALSAQEGGEVLSQPVEIRICPFCDRMFFSRHRKRIWRWLPMLRPYAGTRLCPHCSIGLD